MFPQVRFRCAITVPIDYVTQVIFLGIPVRSVDQGITGSDKYAFIPSYPQVNHSGIPYYSNTIATPFMCQIVLSKHLFETTEIWTKQVDILRAKTKLSYEMESGKFRYEKSNWRQKC